MSDADEPFQPDTILAKMLRVLMVAGEGTDAVEGATLDLYNDIVKVMPTSMVSGLRALCTAELHERGEET